MNQTKETDHARQNAVAWLETITSLIGKLDGRTYEARQEAESAREEIQESALDIEVRTGWHTPGQEPGDGEYFILLTTGGPALRIIGQLDQGEAETARLEYQDWGTPWTEYRDGSAEDDEAVLRFAQQFYFGS